MNRHICEGIMNPGRLSERGKLDHYLFFKIKPCRITSYSRRLSRGARNPDCEDHLVRDLLEVIAETQAEAF